MPGVFGSGLDQALAGMKKKSPQVENASSPQENVSGRQVEIKKPSFSVGQDVLIVRSKDEEKGEKAEKQSAKVEEYKTDTETVVVSFIDKASGRKATKEIPAAELQKWQENITETQKFENAEIKRDSMMEKIRGRELQDAQNILFSETAMKNPQMAARAYFKKLWGVRGKERELLVSQALEGIRSRIDAIPKSFSNATADILNNQGAYEIYKRSEKTGDGKLSPREIKRMQESVDSLKEQEHLENQKLITFSNKLRDYNVSTFLTKPFKRIGLNSARRALQEGLVTPTGRREAFKLTDRMRKDEIDNYESYHTKQDLAPLEGISDDALMERFQKERIQSVRNNLYAVSGALELVPSYVAFEKGGGNAKSRELDSLVVLRQYVFDGMNQNPFVQ